jgi:hypothetical protein
VEGLKRISEQIKSEKLKNMIWQRYPYAMKSMPTPLKDMDTLSDGMDTVPIHYPELELEVEVESEVELEEEEEEERNEIPLKHDEPIFQGESPVKIHPLKAVQKTPEFEDTMNRLFEEFWEVYPKKQNRKLARAAFDKIFFPALGREKLNERADNVIEQCRRYAQDVTGTEPRFIKMPENWLLSIDPEEVVKTEMWIREEEIV